jgi:hypothetical protein
LASGGAELQSVVIPDECVCVRLVDGETPMLELPAGVSVESAVPPRLGANLGGGSHVAGERSGGAGWSGAAQKKHGTCVGL